MEKYQRPPSFPDSHLDGGEGDHSHSWESLILLVSTELVSFSPFCALHPPHLHNLNQELLPNHPQVDTHLYIQSVNQGRNTDGSPGFSLWLTFTSNQILLLLHLPVAFKIVPYSLYLLLCLRSSLHHFLLKLANSPLAGCPASGLSPPCAVLAPHSTSSQRQINQITHTPSFLILLQPPPTPPLHLDQSPYSA